MKIMSWMYALLFTFVLFCDRITKYIALISWQEPVILNKFCALNLVYNRGISWGMLASDTKSGFLAVFLITSAVFALVIYHARQQWLAGKNIFGEVLVIAGAFSNLIDRIYYHHVIDFIHCGYGSFVWPTFNVADTAIFFGACIMLIQMMRES